MLKRGSVTDWRIAKGLATDECNKTTKIKFGKISI